KLNGGSPTWRRPTGRRSVRTENRRWCSDSAYRRPIGDRGCESKRGDARCAQGNKHCSYVFVDSSQITGGRNTPGKNPQAPARRNVSERPSRQAESVSLSFSLLLLSGNLPASH